MARTKKSWREKLADSKDLPKVEKIGPNSNWKLGGARTVVVPAPMEVDARMRKIRKGRVTTIAKLREHLAKEHGADAACPMTTGIFAWIAAWAADEASQDGARRVTPWWRTLKNGGELNPKYPGGLDAQQALLEEEGHRVVTRGKRRFVEGWEQKLQ